MLKLENVTLLGVDCIDLKRLQLAANISTKDISFGKVKILSSIPSEDPRVIAIEPIKSTAEYSDFMIKELDRYVDTEYVIIFQYDGFILNPQAWDNEFLSYDYIGAPWYHLGSLRIGNGGFSLRSKKLLTWLAENYLKVDARIHPEDVFISKFARPFLEKEGMRFPSEELAGQFSKEGNEHSVVWNGEFGFHGITYTDISNWLSYHCEYKKELTFPLDDYATLMKKYPVYTGKVHTFRFGKYDLKNYKLLFEEKKNYEIRTVQEKYHDLSTIKEGDVIVCKRTGVAFKDFPIPAFEKTVKRIQKYKDINTLQMENPTLLIVTPPFDQIPKRMRIFARFFPSFFIKKDKEYIVFWF